MDREALCLLQILELHLVAYLASENLAESYLTVQIFQTYNPAEKSRYTVLILLILKKIDLWFISNR